MRALIFFENFNMPNKDLETREDIYRLVASFYEKVKCDTVLAPFFLTTISNWEEHLELLTTFWETSLFLTKKIEKKYTENPLEAHVK